MLVNVKVSVITEIPSENARWNADMKFLCMKQTLSSGPSVTSSFSHGACVGHKNLFIKNIKIKFYFKEKIINP